MKTMTSLLLFVCLFMGTICASPAYAIWLADGTPIYLGGKAKDYCPPLSNCAPCKIVSDGAGGAIMTWVVEDPGSNRSMLGQRVDGSGRALWAADGEAMGLSYYPSHHELVSDGSGGAIIISVFGDNIYAQRVDGSGNVLWSENPVFIYSSGTGEERPRPVSDGSGGVIITWVDLRSGPNNSDIYAQRVDASGNVLWATQGDTICAAANEQFDPQLVSDASGGAIIAWLDSRSGAPADIYAQRVDASGNVLWAIDGAPICTTAAWKNDLVLVSDGSGGAIISWENSVAADPNIYAQRVDASGNVLWATEGNTICAAANAQTYPRLVSDGSDGAIITWTDSRGGAGNYDIYAQRVDGSGDLLWTADVGICTAMDAQSDPQILYHRSGGAIITWVDKRSDSGDVYAQRVDGSGNVLWTIDGVEVCTAGGVEFDPQLVSDASGGAIIAWMDDRFATPPGYNIFARGVDANGSAPACEVQPTAIDFDTVVVGGFRNEMFTITNNGTGTLPVNVGATCAQYAILAGGGTDNLTAGQSKVVVVRYEPVSVGTHACLVTTGVDGFDVLCTGVAEEAFPNQLIDTEIVDESGDVGEYTSIALDAQGNPHISYYSTTATALRYATKVGGTWTRETVDATGDVGWWTSLALDAQGNPHVSYRDHANGYLKYATKVGGTWTRETVDATGDVGWHTSLSLDVQGNPHVS